MSRQYPIRLATEHDLAELVRLENAAFETDRFTKDQIEYLLTRSRATTFILESKHMVAGSACMLWRKSHQSARLYNMAVDPVFQGKGFGIRLMRECELEAARRGCDRMTLEVREDNHGAIRFYERLGFEYVRTMLDYYHDGSPGIKMAKTLSLAVPQTILFNVPYYAQTLDFTCGPACMIMALKYFYPEMEITRALEMTLWKEATLIFMAAGFGGTDGYGMALSAITRGLNCRLVTSMDTPPMLKSVRIQQKREIMTVVHNDLKRRARRAGLGCETYEYGIDEIVSALHRGLIPIVMISTYRLTGDRVPHWVIVTGIDQDHVFIHDPDIPSYKKNKAKARNIRIEKTEFLRMSRYGKEVYRSLLIVGPKKPIKAQPL